MKLNINNFDIKQIADSGECFRWNKISEVAAAMAEMKSASENQEI